MFNQLQDNHAGNTKTTHIIFLNIKLLNTRVVHSACKHMDL